jgi:prephenate dehydratase
MVEGNFSASEFYTDVEVHPADPRFALALEELQFFSKHVTVLGSYPGHAHRLSKTNNEENSQCS